MKLLANMLKIKPCDKTDEEHTDHDGNAHVHDNLDGLHIVHLGKALRTNLIARAKMITPTMTPRMVQIVRFIAVLQEKEYLKDVVLLSPNFFPLLKPRRSWHERKQQIRHL